ncbi:MAG: hypothetical protein COU29_00290 [Candidatus Magasanikbacteria bacterium CG10_big_fil_rev_8_21_14_0_10_36_32]|uniref:Uncharacterized protein n=1 Tax=Candidatus Magasanikbacteria bacterium CG10_big_fil_rev_8_21_14_0_10_36_32 TaxID=1974646 RepID=A0A2M6W7S3_9BACT|nr:MAG: hypothetical protein COU29_00290 [Candidatus Magasanikbacteria bacterium CG10_big_fil_rev_8_21_14_0_10_36_32]
MKKNVFPCLMFLGVLFLAGCVAGPNTAEHIAASNGHVAGFVLGLWHGMIAPVTFVMSLFTDNVNFYEIHNNGGWYNLGFVLGAGILFGTCEITHSAQKN